MNKPNPQIDKEFSNFVGSKVSLVQRSIGCMFFIEFGKLNSIGKKRNGKEMLRGEFGLLVEGANWKLNVAGATVVKSTSLLELIDSGLKTILGAMLVEMDLSKRRLLVRFDKNRSIEISNSSREFDLAGSSLDSWCIFKNAEVLLIADGKGKFEYTDR